MMVEKYIPKRNTLAFDLCHFFLAYDDQEYLTDDDLLKKFERSNIKVCRKSLKMCVDRGYVAYSDKSWRAGASIGLLKGEL